MSYIYRYKIQYFSRVLRICLILILSGGITGVVKAQQDPQFSQYMFNKLMLNPAHAGSGEDFRVTMFHRSQMVGFEGSPTTQILSADIPFKKQNIGAGLHLISDKLGITGSYSAVSSYAYHIDIDEHKTFSMGLQAGLYQYRLHGEELDIRDEGDQTFTRNMATRLMGDFGIGLMYIDQEKNYYAGISSLHINEPDINYTGYESKGDMANMFRHYYITAGYTYMVNYNFDLKPSIQLKYSESSLFLPNFSGDFSLRVAYMKKLWGGATYRTADAMSIFIGTDIDKLAYDKFNEKIKVGYAYDFTTSRSPRYNYNNGSHEVFIKYNFAKKQVRDVPKFQ